MAEARQRDDWQHTSAVCCVIANANPYRKGPPARPSDFDPYAVRAKKKSKPLEVDMEVLQWIFCGAPPKPPAPSTLPA